MNLKYVVAAVAIIALPVCAQAQKPGAMKATNADAQKVVKMLGADKAKVQVYCSMAKLSDQMEEADKKKDAKKADTLAKQMDEMSAKLGPEYVKLMDGLQEMNPDSKEGKEIGTTLEGLDKLCGK